MQTLDRWIDEYRDVERVIAYMTKRRSELNKLIKQELLRNEVIEHKTERNVAHLQIKRRSIDADEGALQQLLFDKHLWEIAHKEVADRDIVKQLYIEGTLTDDDLRAICTGPIDPNVALKVEPCIKAS